jgi:hypothetical protein
MINIEKKVANFLDSNNLINKEVAKDEANIFAEIMSIIRVMSKSLGFLRSSTTGGFNNLLLSENILTSVQVNSPDKINKKNINIIRLNILLTYLLILFVIYTYFDFGYNLGDYSP